MLLRVEADRYAVSFMTHEQCFQEITYPINLVRPLLLKYCRSLNEALEAKQNNPDGSILSFLPTEVQFAETQVNPTTQATAISKSQKKAVIGILALQGDYTVQKLELDSMLSHVTRRDRLNEKNTSVKLVRSPSEVAQVDALILPGGWSNLQSQLMKVNRVNEAILKFRDSEKPILAVCAGMILARTRDGSDCQDRISLGLIDMKIDNNVINGEFSVQAGSTYFDALFSNAPIPSELGPSVKVVSKMRVTGEVVGVKQGRVLAFSYHGFWTLCEFLDLLWEAHEFAIDH